MQLNNIHRLLKRQIKKSGVLKDQLSPEMLDLLNRVNESYGNHDEDRRLLESSIDISSEEFRTLYDNLKSKKLELEKSYEILSEFSYVAAHDLKEPLRTISSFTQLALLNEGDTNEKCKEYLKLIKQSANHMDRLIKSLITYSRMDSFQSKVDKRVSLNDIIENVKVNLFDLINSTNTEIKISGDFKINCDPLSIYQLFQNLISNSIKYKCDHNAPLIKISSQEIVDAVKISVQDNGIGIDKGFRDLVFEPFRRLHTREKYNGAGIGLSICKKVVDNHGGKIWIDPEYNLGTLVHFTLCNN